MTRKEVLEQFDVYPENPIVISSPGKFEAEAIWVPHFWYMSMEGGGDEEVDSPEGLHVIMDITPEDLAQFPELKGSKSILMWETDTGFVYGELQDKSASEVAAEMEGEIEEAGWTTDESGEWVAPSEGGPPYDDATRTGMYDRDF
jgi:hypothetical protein